MFDGEEPLACLLKALDSDGKALDSVPNLCYKRNNVIHYNPVIEQDFINDTVPDFDGFSLSKYFMPELILPIYSSRQCFNHCAFCTIPGATGGCYRKMPVSKVFEIMCALNDKYGSRVFSFVDETFEAKRMELLADQILSAGKNFFWHCETRFSPLLNQKALTKIYKSGCRQIQFGLESYNQRVLDLMMKNTKIEWVDQNINACLNAGIPVHLFFMIGFPTETRNEALRTLSYTEKVLNKSKYEFNVPYSTRGFTNFGLVVGSDVWNHPDKYGVMPLNSSPNEDLRLEVDYSSKVGLTSDEARALSDQHHIDFYIEKMLEGYDVVDLPQRLHISEVTWILDSIHSVEYKGHLVKVERRLTSLKSSCRIWLDRKTSFTHEGRFVYFYNPKYHHVFKISETIFFELKQLLSAPCSVFRILERNDSGLVDAVEGMLHYGMVDCDVVPSYVMHDSGLQLVRNTNVKEIGRSEEGLHILLSTSTHRMCAVNDFSLAILALFEKAATKADVLRILKVENVLLDEEHLDWLIDNCLKADILCAIK